MNAVNMSQVNGRKVAVDWAVPKDTYVTAVEQGTVHAGLLVVPSLAMMLITEKADHCKNATISSGRRVIKFEDDDSELAANKATDNAESDSDSGDESEEEGEGGNDIVEKEGSKIGNFPKKVGKRERGPDAAVEEGRALFVRYSAKCAV